MENFKDTPEKKLHLLQSGELAPNFNLSASSNQKFSLFDFRGVPVVLIFYPADWNTSCGDQLALYSEIIPKFKEHRARLFGISVDNVWSHLAFSKNNNLHFPLLADFEPKGSVAKSYGAYDSVTGTCQHALFIINPQGRIHWSYLSPPGDITGTDALLEALNLIPKQLSYSPAEFYSPSAELGNLSGVNR